METNKQKIAVVKSILELEMVASNLNIVKMSEGDADYISKKFISLMIAQNKPNFMITLNYPLRNYWRDGLEVDIDALYSFRRFVGLFIRRIYKLLYGKIAEEASYEDWFPFFAAFEDLDKDGNRCHPHYHILLKVPWNYVGRIVELNESLREIWFSIIKTSDERDYHFTSVDDNVLAASHYVSKYAELGQSFRYSIDNSNLGMVTARIPRQMRVKCDNKKQGSHGEKPMGVKSIAIKGGNFEKKLRSTRNFRREFNNSTGRSA